jgi:hypothetical protein
VTRTGLSVAIGRAERDGGGRRVGRYHAACGVTAAGRFHLWQFDESNVPLGTAFLVARDGSIVLKTIRSHNFTGTFGSGRYGCLR